MTTHPAACGQSRTIHEAELDRNDVVALLDLHFAEMRADSPPEACHVLPLDGLRDPAIRFFSMRDGEGELLGVGALKTLDPHHGEIKSMRANPSALGQGVGRDLLSHLVVEARAAGFTRLSLETGNSELFAPARKLYESGGFTSCDPFGGYLPGPFTHFYSREI